MQHVKHQSSRVWAPRKVSRAGAVPTRSQECYDNVRLSLTKENGVWHFESFDIVDAPECNAVAEQLRNYLLDRSLGDVDLQYLQSIQCQGNGACMRAVIDIVHEYQGMFV